METLAVVFEEPESVGLRSVTLEPPGDGDAVVRTVFSGISTGTERLLFSGRMPPFPGLGYPLVPGYETVAQIERAPSGGGFEPGDWVFVPGARAFVDVRGLFGGAAARLVVDAQKLIRVDASLGEQASLLALAATAWRAVAAAGDRLPGLVVGHGVLGRLVARIVVGLGGAPTVWETNASRREGSVGYSVTDPGDDPQRNYECIVDVSGDASALDGIIARSAPAARLILAGFYSQRPSFDFPPAFMRELELKISAEWKPADLEAVRQRVMRGQLSLEGLITHRHVIDAERGSPGKAYRTAFEDPDCLKMIIDWRSLS
ncbi:MAG: chlorophyll synthesis pathway protein BchC [Myxococcota bacterium]